MNRNQLIFLLAALVLIGSAGLILVKRNKDSWDVAGARMGDKVLPNFQPNGVAAIHLKGRSDLHLVHQADLWRVQERDNYPANFHQISDTLIRLKDLKVVESETASPSDLGKVNLDGTGTLVEFKDAQGGGIDSLIVGKKHVRQQGDATSLVGNGEPDGCYILLTCDPKDVLLISDPLSALQSNPALWLSKEFFRVTGAKSIALLSTNPANSWKITRESASSPWTLADAKPDETLDGTKAARAADALDSPRMIDVVTSHSQIATGLDKPLVVTVETLDHFSYTLKVGGKSPDGNYYLTVTVTAENPADKKLQEKLRQESGLAPWVFVVGAWTIEPVLRDRPQLLQGYVEPNPAETPAPAKGTTNSIETGWKPRVIQ